MSKKPETVFKERVLKDLGEIPRIWVCKIQQVSKRGIPDVLICLGGKFIAIELKKDEQTKVDPLQDWTLQMIAEAGGMGVIAYPDVWPDILDMLFDLVEDEPEGLGEVKH